MAPAPCTTLHSAAVVSSGRLATPALQHCSTAALVCSGWALHQVPAPAAQSSASQHCQPARLQTCKIYDWQTSPPPPHLPGTSLAPTNQKWCVRWSRVTCHVSGAGRLTPNNYSVAGAGKLSAAVWSVDTARSHNVGTPRPGHSPGQWTQGSTSQ